MTLDGRLLLVADRADADLARAFAKRIGGDLKRAAHALRRPRVRRGRPRPRADREAHALLAAGDEDAIALRDGRRRDRLRRRRRLDFEVSASFDRVRVDGGGQDR